MFEVTEKEATGEVAEIYQDIRETMDMPFVNTIWRNFATKEGVLQWVWYSLKPIYESGAVAHYASELRSSLDVSSVSPIAFVDTPKSFALFLLIINFTSGLFRL